LKSILRLFIAANRSRLRRDSLAHERALKRLLLPRSLCVLLLLLLLLHHHQGSVLRLRRESLLPVAVGFP
jgi:hypothetical protein